MGHKELVTGAVLQRRGSCERRHASPALSAWKDYFTKQVKWHLNWFLEDTWGF